MNKSLNRVVIILCVVGAALSGVSLYNHYGSSTTEYCDLNEMFNCDLVNRSSYARFFGIPVALIGLIGYSLLFALSIIPGRAFLMLRICAAFVGLCFAIYLAYIEASVLGVWCLLCIGSLLSITGIYIISSIVLVRMNEVGFPGSHQSSPFSGRPL